MSHSLFDIHHRNFEQYFNQNRDKPWKEWLVQADKHKELNDGKQGFTGILQHPTNKNMCCLYKISKADDNLIDHEYEILNQLKPLAMYCPHIHNVYGILSFDTNLFIDNNPLRIEPKEKIIKRDMLLMQFISHKYNFNQMIEDETIKDEHIINIMKQVILTIYMAQQYNFTHYDLHSENILVRNCNPNLFILYIFDQAEYLIPTNGYISNIIDFGFSYCNNPSLTCTLVHTQYGFTSSRFDPCADIKLFMVSVVDDIFREEKRKKISNRLANIVRNIFSGMNIHWSSGWDKSKLVSPVKIIRGLMSDYVKESVLFSTTDIWFDTIQVLIDLPLNPMDYHNLETCVKGFIEEFVKFEERISSKTLLNHVLRIFVNLVKEYRTSYLRGGEETEWSIFEIKKQFLEKYTQLVNYHVPSIDYDKMICSLLVMSQCLEGLFYEYLEKRYTEKDKQYQIMRVKNILDFYHVLEHNFENTCKYKLTHKSNILIVDHIHKQSKTISLTKEDFQKIQTLKEDWESISKFIRNTYLSTLTES
jgi:hypothetical protein